RSLGAAALAAGAAISACAAPKLIARATQTGSRYLIGHLLGVYDPSTYKPHPVPRRHGYCVSSTAVRCGAARRHGYCGLLYIVHRRQMQRRDMVERYREALALEVR